MKVLPSGKVLMPPMAADREGQKSIGPRTGLDVLLLAARGNRRELATLVKALAMRDAAIRSMARLQLKGG